MLLPPKKKLFRIHLKYFFLLSFIGSVMIIILWLPFFYDSKSGSYMDIMNKRPSSEYFGGMETPKIELLDWTIFFTLIIGLLLFIESLFFWTPSLLEFTVNKEKAKMYWGKSQYGLIERRFCYEYGNIQIIVRRKRSSFRGLLMKEFLLEIHLPLDDPRVQQISNFTGIQKKIETDRKIILIKTIDLKYLTLQLIQIQAMIALPFKV